MADWTTNVIMEWNGVKVTDHGRQPLQQSTERFGVDKRMADATLRRQHIALKRSWQVQWENLPSTNTKPTGMKTADGGMSGEQLEAFYRNNPGKFRMVLRRGSAIGKTTPNPSDAALPYEDADFYIVNVMLVDFTKEVRARGVVDLWSAGCTLEEV